MGLCWLLLFCMGFAWWTPAADGAECSTVPDSSAIQVRLPASEYMLQDCHWHNVNLELIANGPFTVLLRNMVMDGGALIIRNVSDTTSTSSTVVVEDSVIACTECLRVYAAAQVLSHVHVVVTSSIFRATQSAVTLSAVRVEHSSITVRNSSIEAQCSGACEAVSAEATVVLNVSIHSFSTHISTVAAGGSASSMSIAPNSPSSYIATNLIISNLVLYASACNVTATGVTSSAAVGFAVSPDTSTSIVNATNVILYGSACRVTASGANSVAALGFASCGYRVQSVLTATNLTVYASACTVTATGVNSVAAMGFASYGYAALSSITTSNLFLYALQSVVSVVGTYSSSAVGFASYSTTSSTITATNVTIQDGVVENLRINETEFSTADAMMFAGMFFGTFLAGFASDRYGRRLTSLSWNVVALIGGLSLAASPNVFALSAAMFVTGFGIGGLHPSAALNVEVLPSSCRNLGVTLWTAFWTCGVLCECLIAAYTLTYSWRVTVIFSTIPVAVCMMFSFLWDESPRYLAMVGQHKQAHDVIRKIAKVNGRPDAFPSETVLARPTISKQVPPKQAMKLLFASDIRVVTFILWLLWTTSNVSYYGFMIHANSEQFGSLSRYASTAITTCGELPSFPLQLYLGDGVGRRQAFVALATSLAALFVAMQVVGDSIALLKVVLFFLTRTFVNTLDNLLFTFTSEAYPTQIRSVGIGTCSAVARIFGILVPFLAIPLYAVSPWAATLVFAGINAGSALGASYLPFDTKGRALQDGAGDDTPREDSVPMEAIEK